MIGAGNVGNEAKRDFGWSAAVSWCCSKQHFGRPTALPCTAALRNARFPMQQRLFGSAMLDVRVAAWPYMPPTWVGRQTPANITQFRERSESRLHRTLGSQQTRIAMGSKSRGTETLYHVGGQSAFMGRSDLPAAIPIMRSSRATNLRPRPAYATTPPRIELRDSPPRRMDCARGPHGRTSNHSGPH